MNLHTHTHTHTHTHICISDNDKCFEANKMVVLQSTLKGA